MLGFYDYTVVLTYISFASAVSGIFLASSSHIRMAVFCLALSGLCDMFDGKVARTKKNRTDDEKSFGIQIDSLCDMVCFGVLPIVICYRLGMDRIYSMAVLILYGLAGLIRLAYFNVTEAKRQEESSEARKYYQGLPITSMAIALPVFVVLSPLIRDVGMRVGALHVLVAVVGILFVVDFKLKKPSPREVFILVGIVALAVVVLMFVWEGWLFFLHRYLYRLLGKTFETAFLFGGGIAV
ncbi:MAG: CDP-alcohol phosphatidyltransferase family protein [Lachnospiraceae bacterium]|nr:CDP-alcohol phosphatidyltransferase family protein [Lachnospiraceae bacterium]